MTGQTQSHQFFPYTKSLLQQELEFGSTGNFHPSISFLDVIVVCFLSHVIASEWFSGDTDGRVPVLSTRYSISTLGLPITKAWRPWYHEKQVLMMTIKVKIKTSGVTSLAIND